MTPVASKRPSPARRPASKPKPARVAAQPRAERIPETVPPPPPSEPPIAPPRPSPGPILDPDLKGRRAYAGAFRLFAVGWILIFLDLSYNGIDVLPDVLGLIFILVGTVWLRPLHDYGTRLVALSAASLAFGLAGSAALFVPFPVLLVPAFAVVDFVLHALLIWFTVDVIIDLAFHLSRPELAGAARERRRLFIGSLILSLAAISAFLVAAQLGVPLALLAIVVGLVATIALIDLFFQASRALAGLDTAPPAAARAATVPALYPVPAAAPRPLYPLTAPDSREEPESPRVLGVLALLAFLVVAHILLSVLIGEAWSDRLTITLTYCVPAGLAMALFGYARWRTPLLLRLLFALVIGGLVLAASLVGGGFRLYVHEYFLFGLPVWVVLAVTGTGRFRWTPLQLLGATLILQTVWITLYGSFPALTQLATASGTLQPYSVSEMYIIASHKLLHEAFLIVVGLLLLARRFPFVQKPLERGDWHATMRLVGGHNRRNAWITVGLGATTFLLALFGSLYLQDLLSGTPVAEQGADDTRVFERITPELVILLSFAAGVGEELIFRGVLQPAIERTLRRSVPTLYAALAAIVIQALLFGIVHAGYGNLLHVLLPFGFGLLTGVVYRLYGLVPAVYAHFMIDVFAFGYDAAQTTDWVNYGLTVLLFLNLLAGIAAPAWLFVDYYFNRRRGELAEPAEAP